MTEYDYSPAAIERFIAQQNRVSNWVTETSRQAHQYSNPFVLSPTLRDRSFYDTPDDPPPTIAVPRSGRRTPTRSTTLPPQYDQRSSDSSSRPSRSRSKSYSEHQRHLDHEREPRSRHRSQSHTRSSSVQRSVQVIYPQPPPPHTSRRHSHSHSHIVSPVNAQPFRVQTAPGHVVYQYPSGHGSRPAYYTPPPPGQIYQATPGGGQPPNISREHDHYRPSPSRHNSKTQAQSYLLVQGGGPKAEYRRGPPIHSPVPTKPHSQPLLKRLLGFVTMSPVGGRSGRRSSY